MNDQQLDVHVRCFFNPALGVCHHLQPAPAYLGDDGFVILTQQAHRIVGRLHCIPNFPTSLDAAS
jgi:hypothetical protein